jgi:ATP-dependent Clp protease ATP-binding subunit ClpA
MARVIQEHIKRPLAEELLFGKLADGGHVRVEVADDGESLQLTIEPLKRELEDLRGKGPAQHELAGHKNDGEA